MKYLDMPSLNPAVTRLNTHTVSLNTARRDISIESKQEQPDIQAAFPRTSSNHHPHRSVRPSQAVATSSIRVGIKANKRILLINISDVSCIEAEGNYVLLHKPTGSHILREQISVLAAKLEHFGFVQVHRSVLVNLNHVDSMESLPSGDYRIFLRDGKSYSVARTYKKNLRHLAELWLGACGFDSSAASDGARSKLEK